MTHPGSGNPTWQDYPSIATPVSAAALEAIESRLDLAGFASVPRCEVRLTANVATAAITDLYAQSNWAVTGTDPFSMVKLAPGSGTFSYLQIPAGWAGRYHFRYHSTTSGMGSGGTHAGKITRNAAATANAIGTAMNTMGGAGGDGATLDVISEITLAVGDKIYWGNWTSVATTIPAEVFGVPTAIYARYLGPA